MRYTAIDMDFQFLHFKYYMKEAYDEKSKKNKPMIGYSRCSTHWK